MIVQQGRAAFRAGRGGAGDTVLLRAMDGRYIGLACEPIVSEWFDVPLGLLRFYVLIKDKIWPGAAVRCTPDAPPMRDPIGMTLMRRDRDELYLPQALPQAVRLLWELNQSWGHGRQRPLFIGWREDLSRDDL